MCRSNLESLSFEFFREFARHEYCLKVTGYIRTKRNAEANWESYSKTEEITRLFGETTENTSFADAVKYYTNNPPKKQIIDSDGKLAWDCALPDHSSISELVLLLICRVRNNLFHGGKFNHCWFQPERSAELLNYGLVILKACLNSHKEVHKAYNGQQHFFSFCNDEQPCA